MFFDLPMDVKRISDFLRFNSQKMQKLNLFESKRMFCDLYCLEPGQQQNLHSHPDNDKIYYVIEGQGSFTVGKVTKILQSGEITLAGAGEPHAVENISSGFLTCLVFMAPHPQPEKFV